jgi:hypothetical protein
MKRIPINRLPPTVGALFHLMMMQDCKSAAAKPVALAAEPEELILPALYDSPRDCT